MPIKFYNTLTRKKEAFKPMKHGFVGIYTCGPTVYDFAHIGNFRAYAWEDLLCRWLKYRGYKVKQVMNLTDVDDKTIKGAKKEGIALEKYTDKYKKAFFEDVDTLNIERAGAYPAATEHIPEMVKLIKTLLNKGFAYKTENGDIYYSIAKFRDYGKLSHFKLKKLEAGKRVRADEYGKEQAQDFALWKAWDAEDGDVLWETEIGKGRPGWHIECSAMSMKYLGETFDLHTGGVDNMFPHHENEIAQSEAATGKKFVNCWMHCRHLIVEGKKMSKSLGNFYTLRDLKEYKPEAVRYVLLGTHYRQELNFTIAELKAAEKTIERLNEFVQRLAEIGERDGSAKPQSDGIKKPIETAQGKFEGAMDDDLNIAPGLAAVFDFVRDANKLIGEGKLSCADARDGLEFMQKINSVLGFISFEREDVKLNDEERKLVDEREKARGEQDWKKADEMRNELRKRGIALDDTGDGVKVRRL